MTNYPDIVKQLWTPGSSNKMVILPNVVGKNIADAQSIITKQGLIPLTEQHTIIYKKYNNEIINKIVFCQNPMPASTNDKYVPIGSYVKLFLHENASLKVPNVINIQYKRAREIIEDSGFSVELQWRVSHIAHGIVISQIPDPETPIDTVRLVVSDNNN